MLVLAAGPPQTARLTVNQQLIVACYKRDVTKVVRCLRAGADVNARLGIRDDATTEFRDRWTGALGAVGLESWTPLIALASSSCIPDPPAEWGDAWRDAARSAALQKRIPKGQIDKRREDGMTILRILLSHNCKLEDHDEYGATALYEAVDDDNVLIARNLLEFGANPNVRVDASIDGPSGVTPLHAACRSKELVKLLLEHGADANAKDSEGRTPADWLELIEERDFDLIRDPRGWHVSERRREKPNAGVQDRPEATPAGTDRGPAS
jgi:hypothetical protein